MADYIDEFAVKVTADTSKLTKELKKLRKSLKDMFNTKASTRELNSFEDELRNIDKLAINPFGGWSDEVKKTERVLKKLGATTLKQDIKKYSQLAKEFKGTPAGDSWKKLVDYQKQMKKMGRNYDPATAGIQYMIGKYGDEWEKANSYMSNKMVEDQTRKDFQQQFQNMANARKKLKELESKDTLTPEMKEQIELIKLYTSGKWKKTQSYSAEEKKKYQAMWKEYEAFNTRQKKILDAENKDKGEKKGFFGRIWERIKAGAVLLKRIFTRYLGYQLIKNLFGGIEQGMQNLYQWSRYNKKEWADVFDKSKSMSTALGNAFAVVKTYLTLWITKAFTGIKGFLVDFLNGVSKFFAWITGQKTYVQANKDIMTRWAENNADTRQLIQGFDRLNIWKGNDNTQPKDMFTEYSWAEDKSWLGKLFSGGTPVKEVGKTIGKQLAEGFVTYVLSSNPMDIGGLSAGTPVAEENKSIWQRTKEFFGGLWEGIKLGWGKVKEWFNGIFQKIKTWWNGVTTEDEGDNGEIITRQVEPGFKHALKEWFSNTWNSIKEWFVGDENKGTQGVWQDKIKPFLEGIWNRFSAWMENTFVPLIAKIWENSGIKKAIDTEKDTLGDIGYSIANVLPWNWWKIQNGERPLVRPNAKGGVYTTPALGLVGEASTRNNPELITPQSLLDERLQANNRDLLGAINGMTNNIIAAVNGINMEVKIGDEVIAKSAARGNNAYYKMMGRPLIR